jgi:hypothetical protein
MSAVMETKSLDQEQVVEKKTSDGIDLHNEQARRFVEAQHGQSWRKALRSSPKALLWCEQSPARGLRMPLIGIVGSYSLFTCIMWGYDGLASSVSPSSSAVLP